MKQSLIIMSLLISELFIIIGVAAAVHKLF